MGSRSAAAAGLTILAYVVVTFAVQGASHFLINADHYAGISIMRQDPILPLGIGSMVIQGALFAYLFPVFHSTGDAIREAVVFSWALGGFLASYIVLGEAGKYAVPEIGSWIAVEASVALVQYTAFGLLLGLIHSRTRTAAMAHRTA